MGYNFRPVERDQQYLMPPSLHEWLPEDDLAWVVLDAVEQLDLDAIRARYRADGWGAAAYDPAMMVALLLYAYAQGERSSRRIEARCRRDIGYRVITANALPDHATIARFRAEHELALGELFGQVLRLCAAAGLGNLGLVAIDGTKLEADVSSRANRTALQLDAEIAAILAEAAAVDAAEDAQAPDQRADGLPAELADRSSRLARLREARRQLAEVEATRQQAYDEIAARRAASGRTAGSAPRLEARDRHRWAERNTTDPDSRKMRSHGRWLLGYNGQVAVAEDGLILAAELIQRSNDTGQLEPLVEATQANAAAAGMSGRVGTILADAGYWNERAVARLERPGGPRVLVAPMRPTSAAARTRYPARARMHRRLASRPGRARYRRRGAIVEPVFGQLKAARGVRRLQRRGLVACQSEWRLLCMTHNLLKLWRHRTTGRSTGPGAHPVARVPRRRRPRSLRWMAGGR